MKNLNSIIKEIDEIYFGMENIRITTINIRIIVANLSKNPEARALDVVADHIEDALFALEKSVTNIKKELQE